MRVRAMTASGDMTFGQGSANYLVDSPAAVAQLVLTRLKLWAGEWFLDRSAGVPWMTQVLGTGTSQSSNAAIRAVIQATEGVLSISNYSNVANTQKRTLAVQVTILTIYSTSILGQIASAQVTLNDGTVSLQVTY